MSNAGVIVSGLRRSIPQDWRAASSAVGLRGRLVVMLLLPIAVIGGVYVAFLADEVERDERQELESRRELISRAIQVAVEQAVRSQSLDTMARFAEDLVVRHKSVVRVRLVGPTGKPLVDASLLPHHEGVSLDRLRRVIETGQEQQVAYSADGFTLHARLLPIRPGSPRVEAALEIVYVAARPDPTAWDALAKVGLRTGAFVLVLAVVIVFVLRREVLQPLGRLTRGIRRLAEGEPGPPLPVERHDELGQVTEAFNELARRLQASRRELESEIAHSVELEGQLRRSSTLAAMGKLTSSLAHEVGTPLNVISGRAEVILQTLPPGAPAREDVEVILAQIDRISTIIRSVLDPLRSREPHIQPTALPQVIEGLLPLWRHLARGRRVLLSTAVPASVPRVMADPAQLQQILVNLVVNALDATPPGGRVRLTAAASVEAGEPRVAIEVSDTGRGIASELQPRIFEPFFTTKAAGGGTGLGLAIARDIVRAHNGDIRVRSEIGVGTTFTVVLPQANHVPAALGGESR